MKSLFSRNSAAFLFALMLAVFGCEKSNDPAPVESPYQISLKIDQKLGQYLTDKDGRTLYVFSNDPDGNDACTGQCQQYWPIFNVASLTESMVGPGLDFEDFGSITASTGKPQLTYKGWPLYYFAPDGANMEDPGQIQGDNKNGAWFVAKPDYSIMIVNAQLVGVDQRNYKSDYTLGNGTTTYFTDAYVRTLYTYSNDKADKNSFTVSPTTTNNNYNGIWPMYGTDKIVVPSALDKSQFGSITVFGSKQLTYKHWPIYYFYNDTNRGSNKGVAFPQAPTPPASPCIWPVVAQSLPVAPQP